MKDQDSVFRKALAMTRENRTVADKVAQDNMNKCDICKNKAPYTAAGYKYCGDIICQKAVASLIKNDRIKNDRIEAERLANKHKDHH